MELKFIVYDTYVGAYISIHKAETNITMALSNKYNITKV